MVGLTGVQHPGRGPAAAPGSFELPGLVCRRSVGRTAREGAPPSPTLLRRPPCGFLFPLASSAFCIRQSCILCPFLSQQWHRTARLLHGFLEVFAANACDLTPVIEDDRPWLPRCSTVSSLALTSARLRFSSLFSGTVLIIQSRHEAPTGSEGHACSRPLYVPVWRALEGCPWRKTCA